MKLEAKVVDDVDVLTPHGGQYGGKETDGLRERINELDQSGRKKLLINLEDTSFMGSIAMGVLFVAHAKYAKRGGTVKLCCVDKRLKQIFVIVKLVLVYGENIHETEEEALESFRAMEAAPSH